MYYIYHKEYIWNPSIREVIFGPIDLLHKRKDFCPKLQISFLCFFQEELYSRDISIMAHNSETTLGFWIRGGF